MSIHPLRYDTTPGPTISDTSGVPILPDGVPANTGSGFVEWGGEAAQFGTIADLRGQLNVGQGVYNVKDPAYGAKGDGVNDDGPAFQAAHNAAAAVGARLLIPAPLVAYRIATQVTVDASNVEWEGSGWPEIRCAIPNALNFAASAGRTHLRLRHFTVSNYHHTAFAPCVRIYGTSASASWENLDIDLKVDGQNAAGEGVHLRQVYEGTVRLFSQSGPEVLVRCNAEALNSGNIHLQAVGNSCGAAVVMLNSEILGASANTLLNSIHLDTLKGVTGAATYYTRTTASGTSAAGQTTLTVASTTGMVAGQYVMIAGAHYGNVQTVVDGTHLTLRDNLQIAVSNGDYVIASNFLCVVGPNTEQVSATVPHQESTGVGFWCNAAKGVTALGMLCGSNPYRAMLCTNGSQDNRIMGISFPSIAQLTLMECLDATTLYNELMGWYAETGSSATILTDSTGTATNRAARSLYELSSTLSFDNNSVGVGYRNGDSTVTPVLYTDGTHTDLRPRTTVGGVRIFDGGAAHDFVVMVGSGSPNSVVAGNPGWLYLNVAGGSATTLYVKESGTGTNTGWVGK